MEMNASATPARKTAASAADARKRPAQARRPAAMPGLAKRVGPRPVTRRAPVHPGYFLETRFLKPLNITQQALAKALGISRRRVNELIRGHRGITADTAVRLAIFFSNEATFWMQLQTDWDLHQAARRLRV
jgi:addiction module HigA family antidote